MQSVAANQIPRQAVTPGKRKFTYELRRFIKPLAVWSSLSFSPLASTIL
nr:MAG TPA: hypothetical protein [Caudoviricetes sp.]DAZ43756.1 MAG TPA: hypothetical protein [Caudoviricetes sp.]